MSSYNSPFLEFTLIKNTLPFNEKKIKKTSDSKQLSLVIRITYFIIFIKSVSVNNTTY